MIVAAAVVHAATVADLAFPHYHYYLAAEMCSPSELLFVHLYFDFANFAIASAVAQQMLLM